MPRAVWPLIGGRPIVELTLVDSTGQGAASNLLADTGAGGNNSPFEIVLDQQTCAAYGGNPGQTVSLSGAYAGAFPTYVVRALIPPLGFDQYVRAVAVATVPTNLSGVACFRLLNRFTFGNFGMPGQFGLEA